MTTLLCVVGQHRGGTSATAGALRQMGVHFGQDEDLMPPSPANPRGYHEHLEVVRAHEALMRSLGLTWDSWAPLPAKWTSGLPFVQARRKLCDIVTTMGRGGHEVLGVKDPRMTRLAPLWQAVATELGMRLRGLLVWRDLTSVQESLMRREKDMDELSAWQLVGCYEGGMKDWADRVSVASVGFPDYLGTGGRELMDATARLVAPVRLCYNPRDVAASLDEELVHHG